MRNRNKTKISWVEGVGPEGSGRPRCGYLAASADTEPAYNFLLALWLRQHSPLRLGRRNRRGLSVRRNRQMS